MTTSSSITVKMWAWELCFIQEAATSKSHDHINGQTKIHFSVTNNETETDMCAPFLDLAWRTRWWQQLFLPIIHLEFFLGKILCFLFVELVFMESNLGFLSNLKFALKFIEIQLYTQSLRIEFDLDQRVQAAQRYESCLCGLVFWFIW